MLGAEAPDEEIRKQYRTVILTINKTKQTEYQY